MPQDLLQHVDSSFGASSQVAMICSEPRRMLALLYLLALCLRIKRTIGNLAQLVRRLPNELLVIAQPEDVLLWIHAHLPRSDLGTHSFIIFAFDEVPFA